MYPFTRNTYKVVIAYNMIIYEIGNLHHALAMGDKDYNIQ